MAAKSSAPSGSKRLMPERRSHDQSHGAKRQDSGQAIHHPLITYHHGRGFSSAEKSSPMTRAGRTGERTRRREAHSSSGMPELSSKASAAFPARRRTDKGPCSFSRMPTRTWRRSTPASARPKGRGGRVPNSKRDGGPDRVVGGAQSCAVRLALNQTGYGERLDVLMHPFLVRDDCSGERGDARGRCVVGCSAAVPTGVASVCAPASRSCRTRDDVPARSRRAPLGATHQRNARPCRPECRGRGF